MTQNIALITGASRGLGAAMAEQLAFRGWHVVAVARTVGGLEDLDDRVKAAGLPGAGGLTLAPMDVTNEDAMRHLCRSIHDRWGGLQFWAHSAVHATALAPAPSMDMKDLDKSIAANLRASAFLITMVAPLLQAAKGSAMFFDDPLAGQKFGAAYGASKAGQIALARAWQAESERIGPRVLIETPRPMPTAVRARFFPGEDRGPLSAPRDEAARLIDLI
ncbi:SDR family oxidoreductase [Pseudorhodobacter sp. MZDSW-24AT]|uniref:SDR family NAD(P)-dependent oxidoreductase n=1 Tax=Pseudorhodobacter sp. MZDSW-24AT TaxID=2052957 RepID=UPI000C1E2EEB|nr:SDR family oxidoreductase [Pseudorhodobacter sp. MZDSW-24AT]PJF11122.1 oxidoreductase [Pseudorhodobacter sp. MZDSW-24AT]